MATPTPTETPPELESLGAPEPPDVESAGALESVGGCTALPSAVACAFACAELSSEKRPVAITTMPSMTALAMTLARLMATAAATETPPDEVSALGVCSASPVPLPPLLVEVPSANERSCATWSVTPLDACPVESDGAAAPDSSCGAPAADAFAVADVSEEPCAASVTAPAAVRFRRSVA